MKTEVLQPRHGIVLDRERCGSLSFSRSREWLETNGIGGYASSTVSGMNTRRYHGLLVAAVQPPVGRAVLLSKVEEILSVNGRQYDLSTNRYSNAVHPAGYTLLKEFRLDPFPTYVFEIDGVELTKRIFMVHEENTVVIEYGSRCLTGTPPPACVLDLSPLIAFRDYHATTRRNDALDSTIRCGAGIVTVTPYAGLPSLHVAHNAVVVSTGVWHYNFEYEVEQERGFNEGEDLFNPYVLSHEFQAGSSVAIVASTEKHRVSDVPCLRDRELNRRTALSAGWAGSNRLVASLAAAADRFIVRRGNSHTILAGYPWFGDWGRDTMIALPGLTLATGRFDVARSVLETFAQNVDQGMLPNRFPDGGGQPEYNSVDASLWMFEAARAYLESSRDWEFVSKVLYDVLAGILEWYTAGTRFGIRLDDDGLLRAGEPGVQLTWMDAKVGDLVVTPRHGKPVEVQALWYNALRVMESFAARRGDAAAAEKAASLAGRARLSFNEVFWNESENCLYDVVDDRVRDGSIRPNQILAASLPYSMLDAHRMGAVVAVVERELLTPRGLRTLAVSDPRYRGKYTGGPASRDAAYHQGTIWPWLLGPFITAWMKIHQAGDAGKVTLRTWLADIEEHLSEAGLAQVSEIFDGDAPFKPRGCIAQAWSVGELLRVAVAAAGPEPLRPAGALKDSTGRRKTARTAA